jgi:competence protein ComGE
MLKKSDGFFLVEMLLSLSAFTMATLIILPYASMVTSQILQDRAEIAATHFLYDELMYIKIRGMESSRRSALRQGIIYQTSVHKDPLTASTEVCIYFTVNQKDKQKCAVVE